MDLEPQSKLSADEAGQPLHVRGEFRSRLAVVLDSIEDEAVRALVAEVFEGQKTTRVQHNFACRHCQRQQFAEVEVAVPAAKFQDRVKALTMLLDQGKGRPAEHKEVRVSVTVRGLEQMRELSDVELAAIVGGEAEVAEWSEVKEISAVT